MTKSIFFGVSGEKIPEGNAVGCVKDSVSYNFYNGKHYPSGNKLHLKAKPEDIITLYIDPILKTARIAHNEALFLLDSSPFLANSPCFTLSTYNQNDQVEIV